MLRILGSLTNLFSDNKIPYLNYRVTENLFCKAFSAKNLARADVSVDATLEDAGIGIKTFIDKNGKSVEKIAEFNKGTHGIAVVFTKEAGLPRALPSNLTTARSHQKPSSARKIHTGGSTVRGLSSAHQSGYDRADKAARYPLY